MTERVWSIWATNPREPYCVHSRDTQPASACSECKDGERLAEWREYWRTDGRERLKRRYPNQAEEINAWIGSASMDKTEE